MSRTSQNSDSQHSQNSTSQNSDSQNSTDSQPVSFVLLVFFCLFLLIF